MAFSRRSGRLNSILQQEEHVHLLSVTAGLPLLENWRLMLVEPFREHLPWWLDGRLEHTAAAIEREIDPSVSSGPAVTQNDPAIVPFQRPESPRERRASALTKHQAQQSSRAAASGPTAHSNQLLEAIRSEAYEVAGDPTVRFHLKIDLDQNGRSVSLSLWLTPCSEGVTFNEIARRYVEARISVHCLDSPTIVRLRQAEGTFTPPADLLDRPEDWIIRIGIELIDDAGAVHTVEQD